MSQSYIPGYDPNRAGKAITAWDGQQPSQELPRQQQKVSMFGQNPGMMGRGGMMNQQAPQQQQRGSMRPQMGLGPSMGAQMRMPMQQQGSAGAAINQQRPPGGGYNSGGGYGSPGGGMWNGGGMGGGGFNRPSGEMRVPGFAGGFYNSHGRIEEPKGGTLGTIPGGGGNDQMMRGPQMPGIMANDDPLVQHMNKMNEGRRNPDGSLRPNVVGDVQPGIGPSNPQMMQQLMQQMTQRGQQMGPRMPPQNPQPGMSYLT